MKNIKFLSLFLVFTIYDSRLTEVPVNSQVQNSTPIATPPVLNNIPQVLPVVPVQEPALVLNQNLPIVNNSQPSSPIVNDSLVEQAAIPIVENNNIESINQENKKIISDINQNVSSQEKALIDNITNSNVLPINGTNIIEKNNPLAKPEYEKIVLDVYKDLVSILEQLDRLFNDKLKLNQNREFETYIVLKMDDPKRAYYEQINKKLDAAFRELNRSGLCKKACISRAIDTLKFDNFIKLLEKEINDFKKLMNPSFLKKTIRYFTKMFVTKNFNERVNEKFKLVSIARYIKDIKESLELTNEFLNSSQDVKDSIVKINTEIESIYSKIDKIKLV